MRCSSAPDKEAIFAPSGRPGWTTRLLEERPAPRYQYSMPKPKPSSKSWMDAAFGAVGRFSRRMSDQWKEGEAEAGQPMEPEPGPQASPKTGHDLIAFRWWEVLQVSSTATKDEIRQAYRRLIKENHPDKSGHLSPEEQSVLKKETQQLNDAYERAMNLE